MKNKSILIKELLKNGCRIFSIFDFEKIAIPLGYSKSSIRKLIFEMKNQNSIHIIKSGLYHMDNNFLGTPISAYEIGLAMVKSGYLSYLSAISINNLTDQIPNIIYISVGNQKYSKLNRKNKFDFEIGGIRYKIIHIKKELIFGVEKEWIGEASIKYTNLEKTLVDSLNKPQYCGGFMEVMSYFEKAFTQINIERLVNYASMINSSCLQRLGWCMDKLNFTMDEVTNFKEIKFKSMVKLDVSGLRKGTYNKKWNIIENI